MNHELRSSNLCRSRWTRLVTLAALFAFAPTTHAQSTTSAVADEHPALKETARPGWWAKKHDAVLERLKAGPVDLVYIGDSITQNYEMIAPPHQDFLPTWNKFYAPRNAVNLGYSGDQTGNVLWRLDHGEIDSIHPKLAIIMIGTNNTSGGKQNADETLLGINAIVAKVREKLPATHILLLGILPSELPTPPNKSETDRSINDTLAKTYADSAAITFLDIASTFMKDGKVDWSLYVDPTLKPMNGVKRGPLHPDTIGQRKMAEAIEPTVAKYMGPLPMPAATNP